MKILFAIKNLGGIAGGAEKVLSIVSRELSKRGHKVIILTFDNNKKPFYDFGNIVEYINIDTNKSILSNKFFLFIIRGWLLRKKILKIKPDIVVGFMHSIYTLLALGLIGTKINLIASEHIVPEYYRNKKLEYILINFSTFFLKRITVVSGDIKNKFSFLIRRKMIVLPNPLDPKFLNLSPRKLNFNYKILSVGRLTEQKDHQTLIKAYSNLVNEFPNWKLYILGEGHLREKLESLIEELDLCQNVFLPGIYSNIMRFYSDSDMFVISSKYESFGLVIIEAMAFSLPVIGFKNCPGINKLIINNKTGLLVESGHDRVDALSKAMRKLMINEKIRHEFGECGYKKVNNYYSVTKIIDSWEELLFNSLS